MSQTKKFCPFMSNPDKPVFCNSDCQLYKPRCRAGYECTLQEVSSIAWNTRESNKNNQSAPPSGY